MFKSLSNYISEIINGQTVKIADQKARWKKVSDLQVGAKIAVTKCHRETVGRGDPNDTKIEFDEIVSIKKIGREKVWDIEIEGTHNFVGNNILVHNTYLEGGNVGIGTTNPVALLDVAGDLHVSGYATASASLAIGYNSAPAGVGNAIFAGNVGIGTTNPAIALDVVGSARFSAVGSLATANDLRITTDGTLTTNSSDITMKTNILNLSDTLEKLLLLKPVSFNWISNPQGNKDFGLIAQDVQAIFPEITFTNQTDGLMGINYSKIPTLLIKAVQEQQLQINQLTKNNVLDLTILNKLEAQGAVTFKGEVLFEQKSIFQAMSEFLGEVIFRNKVAFLNPPSFSQDTAGFALIKKGQRQVKVNFATAYAQTPHVAANIIWNADEATLSVLDQLDGYFLPTANFVIAGLTDNGFTIVLEDPAITDYQFSWMAISVKDAKTSVNNEATPTPTPTATPTATPTLTVEPTAIPTAIPTVEPTATPTATVTPTTLELTPTP